MSSRNAEGQLLTKRLTIDKRGLRAGKRAPRENGGAPYMFYDIEHHVNDNQRPWYVVGFDLADNGKQITIARCTTKPRANARLQALLAKQPNRKLSPKLSHKLLSKRIPDD